MAIHDREATFELFFVRGIISQLINEGTYLPAYLEVVAIHVAEVVAGVGARAAHVLALHHCPIPFLPEPQHLHRIVHFVLVALFTIAYMWLLVNQSNTNERTDKQTIS